jgi:hypothetical protein
MLESTVESRRERGDFRFAQDIPDDLESRTRIGPTDVVATG